MKVDWLWKGIRISDQTFAGVRQTINIPMSATIRFSITPGDVLHSRSVPESVSKWTPYPEIESNQNGDL